MPLEPIGKLFPFADADRVLFRVGQENYTRPGCQWTNWQEGEILVVSRHADEPRRILGEGGLYWRKGDPLHMQVSGGGHNLDVDPNTLRDSPGEWVFAVSGSPTGRLVQVTPTTNKANAFKRDVAEAILLNGGSVDEAARASGLRPADVAALSQVLDRTAAGRWQREHDAKRRRDAVEAAFRAAGFRDGEDAADG